jgi:hypothetical protein
MNLPRKPIKDTIIKNINALFNWARLRIKSHMRLIWILGVILLAFVIVYQVAENWSTILTYRWQFQWKDLLLGFLVYTFNLLLTATNWGLIVDKLAGTRKSVFLHWRLYCISNIANRLPTPLPWIGARVEAYSGVDVPRSVTLTAMSIDLIAMMVAATVVALVTLPFGPHEIVSQKMSPLVILILILLIAISIKPKWLFKFFNWLLSMLHRTPVTTEVSTTSMLSWIGIYLIVWSTTGVLYYLISNSIYPLQPNQIFLIINICAISGVIGWIGQLFFFLPNLALRQIALASLLSFVVPWPVAVADALFLRIVVLFYEVAWALFFFLLGYFQSRRKHDKLSLVRRKE